MSYTAETAIKVPVQAIESGPQEFYFVVTQYKNYGTWSGGLSISSSFDSLGEAQKSSWFSWDSNYSRSKVVRISIAPEDLWITD